MKCHICNRSLEEVTILDRANPIRTVPALWLCRGCQTPEQRAATDTEVKEICDIIATGNVDL